MNRRRFIASLGALSVPLISGCMDNEDTSSTPATESSPTEQSPSTTPSETHTDDSSSTTETATDTPRQTPNGTETPDAPDDTTETPSTPADSTDHIVKVGPNDEPRFSPASLTVNVGETVKWVWESDDHNIQVTTRNDEWTGTPGEMDTLYEEGYTHEHTFSRPGSFDYYCALHTEMTATLTVE